MTWLSVSDLAESSEDKRIKSRYCRRDCEDCKHCKIFAENDASYAHRKRVEKLIRFRVPFLGKGTHGKYRNDKEQNHGDIREGIFKRRIASAQVYEHYIYAYEAEQERNKKRSCHVREERLEFSFEYRNHFASSSSLPASALPPKSGV